jgi:hypothetical protein
LSDGSFGVVVDDKPPADDEVATIRTFESRQDAEDFSRDIRAERRGKMVNK